MRSDLSRVAPANLPIGTVHFSQSGVPEVEPFALLQRLEIVRIFDYGMGGVTAPDDSKTYLLLPGETRVVSHQVPIRNALVVKAASITMTWVDGASYTGAANVIVCTGGSYAQRQLT